MTSVDEFPPEVQVLLGEAEEQTGGDLTLAIDILRERVVGDPGVIAERAALVSWLLRCDIAHRLQHQSWSPGDEEPRARPTRTTKSRLAS